MAVKAKIAEVISASSVEFTAQCYKLNHAPPLGSLIETLIGDDMVVFGVVYSIETHGLEPGRRVMVRGDKLDREEQIYDNNPHLESLLTTDFKALIVGYRQKQKIYHYLPPLPSSIHSFVYLCEYEEVKAFSQSLNFLNSIVESKLPTSPDEVVAACLRSISAHHENQEAFLVRAGKELVWTLGGDIRRLNAILKRLEIGK